MFEKAIILSGVCFKQFEDTEYYINEYGGIYSGYKRTFLTPYISELGFPKIKLGGKHYLIADLVYNTWIGLIPQGYYVNYIDGNISNVNAYNLYLDINNIVEQTRSGNKKVIIKSCHVYDKYTGKIIFYRAISDFIRDSGASLRNNNINDCFKLSYVKERYTLLPTECIETKTNYSENGYGGGIVIASL